MLGRVLKGGAAAAAAGVLTATLVLAAQQSQTQSQCEGREPNAEERREFWVSRWKEYTEKNVKPNFHLPEVNANLVKFADRLGDGKLNVLVPLCGKSLDLLYLGERGNVAGVELAEQAIEDFSKENNLPWESIEKDSQIYKTSFSNGNKLSIAKIDLFNLPDGDWSGFGKFNAVYDRASLIAIDPSLQEQYVEAIKRELAPGAKMLVLTLEYDQNKMQGPPFSVPLSKVRDLYESDFDLDVLSRSDISARVPSLTKKMGGGPIIENVVLLTPKASTPKL